MEIIFRFFLLIMFIPALHASEADHYLENLCPSSSTTASDFIAKNEDIIRVYMYSGGSSEGNYLIVESLKKKFPVNHQFQFSVNKEGVLAGMRDVFTDVYWGIPKVDYAKGISGSSSNCFKVKSKKEIDEALKSWEKANLSELDQLAEQFRYDEVEYLIENKKFTSPSRKYAWRAFRHLAEYKPELALRMIEKGFPVEDKSDDERALEIAIWNSDERLVRAILAHKPNVNHILPQNGYHPLLVATAVGNLRIVQMLLKAGAKARPIPPISQNVLCYLETSHLRGSHFNRRTPNTLEIAKLLIENGADVKADCNSLTKHQNAFSLLDSWDQIHLKLLLLEKGYKLPKENLNSSASPKMTLELLKRGYKHNKKLLDSYEKYQDFISNKTIDLKKIDRKILRMHLNTSIIFEDFDNFKRVVDALKPDVAFPIPREDDPKYNDCSIPSLSRVSWEYYNHLSNNGLKATSTLCDTYSKQSIIDKFLNECSAVHINYVPKSEFQQFEVSKQAISEIFSHWNFKDADYGIDCLDTLKILKGKDVPIDQYQLLRKALESDQKSILDSVLSANLISNSVLQNALDLYADDESLLPTNNDFFKEKSISKSLRDYFFILIDEKGITSKKIKKLKDDFPRSRFIQKKQYLFCSLEGESPAFKRKIEKEPFIYLPACDKLKNDELEYYELYESSEEFLTLISLAPRFHGDENQLLLGSKIYVNPAYLSTPYVLTDGVFGVNLSYGGVIAVLLTEKSYQEVGFESICKGMDEPSISMISEGSTELKPLPAGFDVKNAKIINNLGRKISDICKKQN